jgi:hypothetical protein
MESIIEETLITTATPQSTSTNEDIAVVAQATNEESAVSRPSAETCQDGVASIQQQQQQQQQHSTEENVVVEPNISLESVLETLHDQEEKNELLTMILRFHFQDEIFQWRLIRAAGWTYDTPLGAYHAPPPQTDDEFSKDLPTLTLKATELYEYLDRFAVTKIQSLLQRPTNKLQGMSDLEIKRGRALRERAIIVKFLQERSTKPPAVATPEVVDASNHSKNSKKSKTLPNDGQKRPTRSTNVVKTAMAVKPQTVAPIQPQQSHRSYAASEQNDVSATVFEPGADMFLKKGKASKRGKNTAGTNADTLPFKIPSLSECAKIVGEMTLSSETEAELLVTEENYRRSFSEWKFLLTTNHSLLLHGFGSKQNLLNLFAEDELEVEGDVLIIDGFDSDVSIEAILDVIVIVFLDGREPLDVGRRNLSITATTASTTNAVRTCRQLDAHPLVIRAIRISQSLAANAAATLKPNILVIHNIDGMALRSNVAQEALAALVANSALPDTPVGDTAMRGLWLVASVDHVDAAVLLWDTLCTVQFAWIWKEVHSYRPHLKEIAMMDNSIRRDGGKKNSRKRLSVPTEAAEAVAFEVLGSVAPRCVDVVQILATLQLQLPPSQLWIDVATLRDECMGKCTLRSDEQLRGHLQELNDHGIVETQSQRRGSTMRVRIPYSNDKLHEIIEYKK